MASPLVVYTYSRCSTCRDATRWLSENGISFTERPIYDLPPSLRELKTMLARQDGQLRRLFNTSGLEYRALGLKDRWETLGEEEALALLAGNGRLVKRPFLLADKVGLVGFKPDTWAAALGTKKSVVKK